MFKTFKNNEKDVRTWNSRMSQSENDDMEARIQKRIAEEQFNGMDVIRCAESGYIISCIRREEKKD